MKKVKVRGTYTNWFCPSLSRPIHTTMKKFRNYHAAILNLQAVYKQRRKTKNVYDGLRRSTLYGWFTSTRQLREKCSHCVREEVCLTKADQHVPILSKYLKVEEEIIIVLKKQRTAGQPLYGTTIQPLIKAIIQKRVPHLHDSIEKKGFKVSIMWTRTFIKRSLNWTYRASTLAARKLPLDWKEQGDMMSQRIAYFSKLHDIPPSLVVNLDQIGIHLVPTGGARTWEKNDSKHVCVHSKEDKR